MAKKRKFGLDSSDFDLKDDIQKAEEEQQEETAPAMEKPAPARKPVSKQAAFTIPPKPYRTIGAKTCVIFRGNNLQTLKREAKARGYSMGEFLNMIVEEYFSHPENKTFRD